MLADCLPAAPIRVLSFNIRMETHERDAADNWSGERRDAVVSFLLWVDADVIGLQEVLPSQMQFLQETLAPEYSFVGIGRDADGGGEASPLFYKVHRFTVESWKSFWLSSKLSTGVPGSKFPGAGCPRLATCALIKRCDGVKLIACCTHLDHKDMHGEYQIQRGQAEILTECLQQFCEDSATAVSPCPCMVLGDFNSIRVAGAPPVLVRNGFDDCSGGDEQATFVEFDDRFASDGANQHIDWIFVKGAGYSGYTVYDAKYRNSSGQCRNLSDHTPVACHLHLGGPESQNRQRSQICKVSILMQTADGKS
eukprot:TRINITY_DN37007_c0_g1_i1.p1 TRINITY_DN37007_c0_g1~~TRINITY_DN37007_c0_g1_i1.p1  ORF type:complete len:335 (+),score=42.73 TRINITY_DN37007_c0_g1_i1:80-1006(+)